MITGAHVREWLAATPFKPFRLYISDGSHYDVVHPELAWVLGSRVFIGQHNGGADPNDYSARQVAILHISRIEELSAASSAGR